MFWMRWSRGGGSRKETCFWSVFLLLLSICLPQSVAGYSQSAEDFLEALLDDEYRMWRSSSDAKLYYDLLLEEMMGSDAGEQDDLFRTHDENRGLSDDELMTVLRILAKDGARREKEGGYLDGLTKDEKTVDENSELADESELGGNSARTYDNDLSRGLLDDIMYFIRIDREELTVRKDMQPNFIKVAEFLKFYQRVLSRWRRKSALADWAKETNLTKSNTEKSSKVSLEFSDWADKQRKVAEKFSMDDLSYVQKRMMKDIKRSNELKDEKDKKLENNLSTKIENIYSKAKVCKNSTGKCYNFEPGLIKIMLTSRNYTELLWAWKGWRDAIGPKIRNDWIEIMELNNKGARENGYTDDGEYHREGYEDKNLVEEIEELWEDLEPLYKQLHAYVRYKLNKMYGNRVQLDKPIPAHLLGGMWAMKWDGLLKEMEPYPEVGGFDVTGGMLKKNMTTHRMFTLADEFYQSMGLPPMPPLFWEKSMFTRPKDNRPVVCYASAHNLEKDDVRVKMCAAVNSEYLYVVHHEMGHCQYYLAYNRHQPEIFQSGANGGFHEAIGDTAALSVISPKHLISLGILKPGHPDVKKKKELNFLMQKALAKLAFYPFALTMARWKWDVYSGNITTGNLNAAWWQYRKKYQGIEPPIPRSESDFDPGSKYHITYFVPYIRYFISHVLQFQFYESLCNLSGHKGLLHNCDFYGSKSAGKAFGDMLNMGSSRPWPEALQVLTGTRKMSAKPATRYFAPLITWLEAENKRLGNKIGWD